MTHNDEDRYALLIRILIALCISQVEKSLRLCLCGNMLDIHSTTINVFICDLNDRYEKSISSHILWADMAS